MKDFFVGGTGISKTSMLLEIVHKNFVLFKLDFTSDLTSWVTMPGFRDHYRRLGSVVAVDWSNRARQVRLYSAPPIYGQRTY